MRLAGIFVDKMNINIGSERRGGEGNEENVTNTFYSTTINTFVSKSKR
jgi:hypothetical protein